MATHTYNLNPLAVVTQTATDVLWQASGDADGINFVVEFWQSAVQGMTVAQMKAFIKGIIDAKVFPTVATPQGNLANFNGGSFTL